MNQTVSQAFDSRAMPLLLEPSTAPSAFSLWQWLGERVMAKPVEREIATQPAPQAHDDSVTDHTPK